jgi:hypothetical protein
MPAVAVFVSVSLAAGAASAGELLGKVKSVDVDGKKVVVTEKDTAKDVEVAINSSTTWVNSKGKSPKKFDLGRLKAGSTVEVALDGAVASKVSIKAKKDKKKSKAAD